MSIVKDLLPKFPSIVKDFKKSYTITVIIALLIGLFFIDLSLKEQDKEIERKLSTSAKQIEKTLTLDLDYIRYQLLYTGKQIKFLSNDYKKIEKLLSAYSQDLGNQVDIAITWNSLSWINRDDKIVIDGMLGIMKKPIDLSRRDYLKLAKQNPGDLVFGKSIQSILSQRLIIPAGIGVFSNSGSYLGTIVFGFDIERIVGKIERDTGNETISFAIIKDSEIAFNSTNFNYENSFVFSTIKDHKIDNNKLISHQGIFSKKTPFAYARKIKNYPFSIVTFYDNETSYQQISNIILKEITLLFLAMSLLAILFKKIYYKIVDPVSNLAELAIKTSAKEFNFDIKKPSDNELIELYNAIILLKKSFQNEEDLIEQLKIANHKISTENFNKSEFLAAISHDIRNPLSAISSLANLIKDHENSNNEEIKEWAKDIEYCANEVLQFINDLMDVNQVASGEFSANLTNYINIVDIVKRSIRINRDFAQRHGITISLHNEENIPDIKLDARRMKQILVNLISNSVKYSRENTKVEVYLQIIEKSRKRILQISIKDNGFGMNEQQIQHALKKYGRIENENSNKVDSFGLGLPLVKRLVEVQNGTFEIQSELGIGTTAIISFIIG